MKRLLLVILAVTAALLLTAACAQTEEERWAECMAEAPQEITREYIVEVRDKYEDLFWRQPNVFGVGPRTLLDENGDETEIYGIEVGVVEKVDQGTLPPEGRIPDCLEGVPVQINEREPEQLPPPVPQTYLEWAAIQAESCISHWEDKMQEEGVDVDVTSDEHIHDVRLRHDSLFWRQPNVRTVGEGLLADDNGVYSDTGGIIVKVWERVDQNTLPEEDRIPSCIEGVPVQIRVWRGQVVFLQE